MAATSHDQATYRIKGHSPEFDTGTVSDGCQALLIQITENTTAFVQFEKSGALMSFQEIDNSRVQRTNDAILVIGDGQSIRVVPNPIEVLEFHIEKLGIEILAQPESFDEFMANPEKVEPEARYRERTYQQVTEWKTEGRFILATWGKDYWMDRDGSVFAT